MLKLNHIGAMLAAILLAAMPSALLAQRNGTNITVSGIVCADDTGEPLIGVAVVAQHNNAGVSTGIDGSYQITAPAGTVIQFSYLGYSAAQFKIPAGNETVQHDVRLAPDSQQLEDVVVIAYGVRKKGTIAGSVGVVKADQIESTSSAAFDSALQGQVTGLTVLSNSGEPSAVAEMKIRGTNSINSGTAPLYILDGAAISAADFNTINPSDIESISVLKDASSTSI